MSSRCRRYRIYPGFGDINEVPDRKTESSVQPRLAITEIVKKKDLELHPQHTGAEM